MGLGAGGKLGWRRNHPNVTRGCKVSGLILWVPWDGNVPPAGVGPGPDLETQTFVCAVLWPGTPYHYQFLIQLTTSVFRSFLTNVLLKYNIQNVHKCTAFGIFQSEHTS